MNTIKINFNKYTKIFLLLYFVISSAFSFAQTTYDAAYNPLSFGTNFVNKVGDGTSQGNIVLYSNVITVGGQVIDAVVKTVEISNVSSFGNYDYNTSDTDFFYPRITFDNNGGYIIFNFSFIVGGSYVNASNIGTLVKLKNFYVNTYDIDGNGIVSGSNQYNEFQAYSSYELGNPTNLSVTTNTVQNFIKFRSNSDQNSSTTTAPSTRVRLTYANPVTNLSVKVGADGANLAYFYLDFSVGPTFTGAISTQITDTDGDGVQDSLDTCPNTPSGTTVDASGCPVVQSNPILTAGTLSAFTSCSGFVSEAQSFSVTGSNLTDAIVITAPTGYEVSLAASSGYASSLTLTPTSGSVASTTIYVRLTSAALNGTTGNITIVSSGITENVATGIAVVSPTSVAGSIAGATTVCSGTNSTTLTLSGHTGTIQWQSKTGSNAFANIAGATAATYTATNLTTTTDYQAVVTSGSCASATTASVTITVDPISVAGTITGDTTICSVSPPVPVTTPVTPPTPGSNLTNSAVLTLTGNTGTIQWQSRTGANAFADISGATSNTYTATNLTTTTDYRAIVTNGVCPASTSNTSTITVNPLPTASAGSDATICSVDTYSLSGTATNGTITWVTNGTGTFSDLTISNPVYTPSAADIAAGSVVLTMAVKGENACFTNDDSIYSFDFLILTIVSVPVATVDAGPATVEVCSGTDYATSGVSTNGTVLWTTSGTGTFSDATINTPVYTYSAADIAAGSVTLTMTVTSSAVGSCAANAPVSDTIILNIAEPTTADAGLDTDLICSASTYTLAGSASNGAILWTTSGTGTFSDATIATPVYTPSTDDIANGSVLLTITVTGAGGCTAIATDVINLSFYPAPTLDAGPSTANICAGNTYETEGLSSPGSTLTWSSSGTGTFTNGNSLDAVYTPSAADILAGTVTLTLDSSASSTGACAGINLSDTVVLTISPVPTADAGSATAIICFGETYSPTATASNGAISWTSTGTGTFSDATSATPIYTPSALDKSNGTVSLTMTVTGTGVCSSATVSDTVVLTISPLPTATIPLATDFICAGDTYTLNSTATNGSILWTTSGVGTFNDATSATPIYTPGLTDIGVVTLTITVTGSAGCSAETSTDSLALTIYKVTTTTAQINVSCNGGSNGSATVTPAGGTAPYTYSWSPSGGTGATASNLAAGTYSCTVTDANGCSAVSNFVITQPTVLSATTTQTNVVVNGAATGEAVVTATGGTLPYTYSWTPFGGTAGTASNLTAGTYTCTITDANGCSIVKTVSITQSAVLAATTSQTNILCNGNATGSATVVASGGVPTYTYLWSPSGGTAATATDLAAGNYSCLITDANGASITKTFTITQPTVLSATTTQTNISINGQSTGSATVAVSGGTLPYTYLWSPSGGTSATATNLVAGTYSCTITDANGCSIVKSFIVTQPTALTSSFTQVNLLCNGVSTGSANVSVTGGVAPYSYAWTPAVSTGSTASNLAQGTYTCVVTDANGASVTDVITITQPTSLIVTTSKTDVLCNGNATGSATVVATGGTAGYTYLWSPSGGTAATASNLAAGSYSCTVTDANGCSVVKTFTISEPTSLTATTAQTNILINGANTGSASVSVSGGALPYAYSWSPSGGNASAANNLTAGTYVCTITDANGCLITKSFDIIEPQALSATTTQTNILCNGNATGTATVSVSGGTSPYTYLWSPTGGTNATASNLVAGVYTCSITDANGAILVKTITITQPTALSVNGSQTNVSINGASSGSATVVVTGGTSAYTYLWSPSGGTSATATGLSAGNYTCTITDANNCIITKSFAITQPTALSLSATQTNLVCNGAANGTANVTTSGGVMPYTYTWSPALGTGSSLTGLSAGTYTCVVTDASGASQTSIFTISQPTAITTTTSQTNISCNGGSNGSATVTPAGGTAPYTYSWSPSGGTGATASNLAAGTYSCTVTDANGCSVVRSFTITQPTVLSATTTQTNVSIFGAATGEAVVTATGGTLPYTYSWSPTGGNGATTSNLTAGTYTCTITDANGCSIVKIVTITQSTNLTATTSQTNILCHGNATGSATVVVSGGVPAYTYLWSPSGGTNATAANLVAGNYSCLITDANGASITKLFTITEAALIPIPTADAGPQTASICAGLSYSTSATATNGSVLWTTSGSGSFDDATSINAIYTPSASDNATGTIVLTLSVIAPGSCNTPTATDTLTLTIFPESNAGIISGATSVCEGTNSTVLTLSQYTGTIQWQVSSDNVVFNAITGATSSMLTVSNLTNTTYYRAIVTSGVCSEATTATATMVVNPTSVAGTISGAAPVCYGTNSTQLTLTGNTGTIQWEFSTDNINFTPISGATSAVYTTQNLTSTTYFRAVSTSGVCSSASATATVVVNPLPTSNAGPISATICAGTTFTTSGVATNGSVAWTSSGTGTFNDSSSVTATYSPSAADLVNGSVTLTMTVTGTNAGCSSNTATDTILVQFNSPSAPTANTSQTYCYLNSPTVANLTTAPGLNINWYSAATGGTALTLNTPLVTGTTYYASQTVSGCESLTRTAVLVNLSCTVTALADTLNGINGYSGGTTTSVLTNDLMNGTALVPSNVLLTTVSSPAGFTLNSNGTITVPQGTPAGAYQVVYSICETLNPLNCSQTTATINVVAPIIDAITDNFGPVNGFQGGITASVLNNDLLNGALVIPSEITLSVVTIPTGFTLNADGTITIPSGTLPGIYQIKYQITENLNPSNTDIVISVVTVVDCLSVPSNDCDGDGVTNGQESIDGTNPSDPCSLNFLSQTLATSTAWNSLDCDGDGVTNGQEVLDGTNPTDLCSFLLANQTVTTNASWNNADCDGDGVINGQEIINGTNPLDVCSFNAINITVTTSSIWNSLDCDGDGVTNGQEILDGTNPNNPCSLLFSSQTGAVSSTWNGLDCDGDGVSNGQEILDGTNPTVACSFNLASITLTTSSAWNALDCDGDGVTNGQEQLDGTNPLDLCSLLLNSQTLNTNSIWKNTDCDGDGVTNGQEILDNTDFLDPCSLIVENQNVTPSASWAALDCDGDGVTNGQELLDGTDVNNECDSDMANVTLPFSNDFLTGDCDGDGLTNEEEIGEDPNKPTDADNNGIPDYLEINNNQPSEDDLEVYNVVTPNGNGDNDVFVIRNIQLYPNNTVTIYNRWGITVYEVDSYGKDDRFFKGLSDGRTTLRRSEQLPIGTYFYTIRYVNSEGIQKTRSGYLYLNK